MHQGSKGRTSGPHYGSECWRRGCVPRWVQTPRSAPGFKHRCPSHCLDPEFGAQLQTIQSGRQFGTRRRNPSALRRTVHSDEPSDADAGTRIQRGTGTILRNSVRHTWVRMRAAVQVMSFVPSISNVAHKVSEHERSGRCGRTSAVGF